MLKVFLEYITFPFPIIKRWRPCITAAIPEPAYMLFIRLSRLKVFMPRIYMMTMAPPRTIASAVLKVNVSMFSVDTAMFRPKRTNTENMLTMYVSLVETWLDTITVARMSRITSMGQMAKAIKFSELSVSRVPGVTL